MSEEIKLLECPFCGGPAELEEVDGGGWSVGCQEKPLSVHFCMGYQSLTSFATKREAIAAWNTRAHDGDGWRDIESAQDGVDVLVYVPSTEEQFVAYRDEKGDWLYARCGVTRIVCEPTHWRPLPAPPQSTLEQEKRP